MEGYEMFDVIIIGGGPAGQSAAIFTGKDNRKTLVLDDEKGLTRLAWIKNHFGTEDIEGGTLVKLGREKAEQFGVEFKNAKVTNVTKNGNNFQVEAENGDTYDTSHIILATGATQQLAETIGLETKSAVEPMVKSIVAVDEEGRTSLEGVWACGAAGGASQHTIITSGDGARVATNLLSEIKGKRHVDHDKL